ncbi:MAG: class I SAM-dependent methyltransferase [Polaribacter sp.]
MGKEKEFYQDLKPFLSCTDYTVSRESFKIMINTEYDMLVTLPVPVDLENYYKSEDYISHTDSKKSLLDKIYQVVKKRTLKKKLHLLNSFKTANKTVLDIGAGTGDFLKVCKNNRWKVTGVEPNFEARKIAKKKEIVLKETIENLSDSTYDVITLWHVLEHIPNLHTYLSKLKKLLKPNGKLVIAVPNFKSYDATYYKEHWAAYDVPRHLWHFSQPAIYKLFSSVEMLVENTLPMKYDAFYVSLLSEKYKSGSMKPFHAFYRASISNLKAKESSEYSSLIYVLNNY